MEIPMVASSQNACTENPEKKHCLTVEKGWTWPIEIDEIVSDLPEKTGFSTVHHKLPSGYD